MYQDVVRRPLSLPQADQLVLVGGIAPVRELPWPSGWNEGAFTALGVFQTTSVNVGEPAHQENVAACLADAAFFEVLGVMPERGRLFVATDTEASAPAVVVLSHSFWKSHFADAQDLSDAAILVEGRRIRVMGVLPPGVDFPSRSAIYLPRPDRSLVLSTSGRPAVADDVARGMDLVIGRLRDGIAPAQATQMEMAILNRLRGANKDPRRGFGRVGVRKALDFLVFRVKGPLSLLAVAGCFVACVAFGSLFLLSVARAAGLGKDIAIRRVLGASTSALFVRELFWWLALGSAVSLAVVLFVHLALQSLRKIHGLSVPRLSELALHPSQAACIVLATIFGATLLALPYFLACRHVSSIAPVLNQSGSQTWLTLRPAVGNGVSILQLSLAVALTTATIGVCVKSWRMATAPPGIDPQGVFFCNLTMAPFLASPTPPAGKHDSAGSEDKSLAQANRVDTLPWRVGQISRAEAATRTEIFTQAAFAAATLMSVQPGVTGVAMIDPIPYGFHAGSGLFVIPDGQSPSIVQAFRVHGNLPRTLGMAMSSGRWFDEQDERTDSDFVVVSQRMAAQFFQGQAVGRTLRVEDYPTPRTIIGVVNDIVAAYGEELQPAMYLPINPRAAELGARYALVVRTTRDAALPRGPKQDSFQQGLLQTDQWSSLATTMNDAGATDQASAFAAAWFACVALILAAVSVYAVLWTLTTQRNRELAIRIALGAQPAALASRLVGNGLAISAVASLLGLFLGRGLERLLSSFFYGVALFSWHAFAISFAIILLATLLSVVGPARFALRLSPAEALKES